VVHKLYIKLENEITLDSAQDFQTLYNKRNHNKNKDKDSTKEVTFKPDQQKNNKPMEYVLPYI